MPDPAAAVHVHPPRITIAADGRATTVTARIDVAGASSDLWYTFQGATAEPSADAFVPAVLLAAMAYGVPLVSEAPISPKLLSQLPTLQDIYATWVPALRRVAVMAPSAGHRDAPGPDAAAFFTGGVDSFHTFLSHRAEIGTLVFVHGFASPLSGRRRDQATRMLRRVAEAFDVQVIEVETNFVARLNEWLGTESRGHLSPKFYNFELAHGAALASVAHLLPARIGRVYIAASDSYNELIPWGSHPLLDPLWSTESRTVVHDGCAAARIEKIRMVASSDVALGLLRVCPKAGEGEQLNCGRCEKCLRTMIGLRIAGALDRCPAFAERLDLRRVTLIRHRPSSVQYLWENLAAAQALGTDPELVAALKRALNRWAPRRLALEGMLAGWRLVKRVVPVQVVDGRISRRRAG